MNVSDTKKPFFSLHVLLVLFFFGALYWVVFLGAGNFFFGFGDWVKEDAYLNTLRFSIENAELPWLWNEVFYHSSNKFLANPEIVLTPDIFLLKWISNSWFVIIHIILFYALGFWGTVLLAREMTVG